MVITFIMSHILNPESSFLKFQMVSKMVSRVIATYEYPEYKTYNGPAERAEFVFRNVKGLSLLPDWVFETLILTKARLADVTPLYAVLKESTLKESFLDYVTSEYTLILHYHDSPAIASIILAVAAALTAAGFLVLSVKSDPETWGDVARSAATVATGGSDILKYGLLLAGLLIIGKYIPKKEEA